MARTPTLEKPSSLRLMGVGLLVVLLFFGWLTYAFFTKVFTEYDHVTLTAQKTGLALPDRADVKLRGMIVGVVLDKRIENGTVVMDLGMDPALIGRVPRDVRAEIVPKTLFGEKYISLVPTGSGSSGQSLRAGDTIRDAVVPVEFEKFFNDIYPLLTAVPPEKVGYTLTALANTLEGRGESFGETLELTNTYLEKFTPETQAAVNDIVQLGQLSQTYAGSADEFGRLLRNSAFVSRTVTNKQFQLNDLFNRTDDLADVLNTFFDKTGDDLILTARNSVQPLRVSAEYSTIFPCWFKGLDTFLRTDMDSILKNKTLHIDLIQVAPQATQYDINTERPVIPKESVIESINQTQPEIHGYEAGGIPAGLGTICDELYRAAAGQPRTFNNPVPIPGNFWKLLGVRNSHNGKLGTDADYSRPVANSVATAIDLDTPAQTVVLKRMTTALTGVKTKDVPDVASMLISPVIRGAGVSVQ